MEKQSNKLNFPKNDLICCNFCGQSARDLKKKDMGLIAGHNVFICDECIQMAYEIIQDIKSNTTQPAKRPE